MSCAKLQCTLQYACLAHLMYAMSARSRGAQSHSQKCLCRWETGYWGTMDIAHDRAGYYLCWGCLNWVPAIYTSPALYITEHPIEWSLPAAVAIGIAGTAAIYINYDSDRQRQVCTAIMESAS